jgi:hypothetical protein
VIDCPNCGKQVDPQVALCPECGFHVQSQQAGEVRRLREEGVIHPGRLGAQERTGHAPTAEATERGQTRTELPADDRATQRPEEIDAGL